MISVIDLPLCSPVYVYLCLPVITMLLLDLSPMEQLRRYITQFGDKPCCFVDVQLYIDLLTANEQREVTSFSHIIYNCLAGNKPQLSTSTNECMFTCLHRPTNCQRTTRGDELFTLFSHITYNER